MAKLSDRAELTTPADGDLYVTTDVSDTTDAATGTDKKITWSNIKATLKTYFDTLYAGVLGADDNYVTDAEKVKLSNLSGTNTGDQTNITGNAATVTTNANLTGHVTSVGNAAVLGSFTVAQLNTAISDGDVATGGGTATGTNTGDQTSIVGITGTKAQFDTAVSDGNIMFDGDAITNATGTANRVFYADNSGVITELALGADGTFLKSNGATVAPSFATPAGSGDVSKVGTPVNNQVGVWTGDGTIEGDTSLTWDASSFIIDKTGTEALLIRKDADAGDVLTVDTTNSKVTIGTPDPNSNGAAVWPLSISGNTLASANIGISVFTADATAGGMSTMKARGTQASPTATQADDYLMMNTGRGYGSTGFPLGSKGAMTIRASQTWTDANQGTYIGFETTPDNSTTRAERVKITSTAILPTTSDAIAIGNTTNQFSDLFLAEGGVINWDNGDATLTQVGDVVTLAGADLKVTTPGNVSTSVVTTDATQTLTNKTLTSPTLTTPGAFTTGGTITLAENTSIALDPAGSADGKYSGITIAGTAGTALAFGDLCYLAVADSRWELADADAAATMGTPLLGMCVLAAAGDASATTMLLYGTCRADSKFPALTVGATVYGGETAGAIQTTIPTGADNVIRVIGHALTADEIMFNPSQDHQITVA